MAAPMRLGVSLPEQLFSSVYKIKNTIIIKKKQKEVLPAAFLKHCQLGVHWWKKDNTKGRIFYFFKEPFQILMNMVDIFVFQHKTRFWGFFPEIKPKINNSEHYLKG